MHNHVVWPRKIGPVTVRFADATVFTYKSLRRAVEDLGVYRLRLGEDGMSLDCGSLWYSAVNFYDWDGYFIAPGTVMARVEDVLRERAERRPVFRHGRFVAGRDFEFRAGPVPFTGKRGGGGYYRHMRTTQERRAAAGMAADEDMREHGLRPRARRSEVNLVNCWDDIPRCRGHRSWKCHRLTRWKA